MDLLGKKVLVAGCGKSGLGAAGLLQKAGAVPVLFDENEKLDGKALCAREDYPKDTALVLGSLPKELLSELSLAVLSPGISIEEAFVSTLEEADIPVWGEIELAWNYEKGKVLAITGTNGKTTTTTLVGEILKRYQDNTFVVGNIGTPYTQEVLKTDKDSVTVAEISSFQLETAVHFHPTVSAILNITPDHLNRHKTMECYTNVKLSIAKNQSPEDVVILSIATRPDCLGPDILGLLEELNRIKPVWVELGLQTIHPESARYLRRGYDLPVFDRAVKDLKAIGVTVIVHQILGLPGETPEMMAETARYIGQSGAEGVKLHLLHVLRNTDLAAEWQAGRVQTLELEEYISILELCLRILPPEAVIHRLTGDGAKRDLLAPLWSGDKKRVLNAIHQAFLRDNLIQGSTL